MELTGYIGLIHLSNWTTLQWTLGYIYFFNYNPKIRKFECNARCLNNCDGEDKQTCLECDSAD